MNVPYIRDGGIQQAESGEFLTWGQMVSIWVVRGMCPKRINGLPFLDECIVDGGAMKPIVAFRGDKLNAVERQEKPDGVARSTAAFPLGWVVHPHTRLVRVVVVVLFFIFALVADIDKVTAPIRIKK